MLKKITKSYTLLLMSLMVLLGSCAKDYESIEVTDDAKIKQYIADKNLTVEKHSSGFYYEIITPGAGEKFDNKDSVLYHITLKSLFNGKTYYTDPANGNFGNFVGYTNNLNGTEINAIRESILNISPGGVIRVLLPSYLAFGRNGFTTIGVPSNEVIDLTITTMPEQIQSELDNRLIREHLAKNNITGMTRGPGGIYFIINTLGDVESPINGGSTVTVNYTGRLLDGTVFDSSTDGTAIFSLSDPGLRTGWKKIIPKLNKGGKVRFLAPSIESYGTAGAGSIPANAILDFEVEVTAVTN
jgi:FKBP-type peptidyl-prolyl cis-trans isomerase FkpA